MSHKIKLLICLLLTVLLIEAIPFEAAHVKVVSKPSRYATASTSSSGGDEDAPFSIILEIMSSSKYFRLLLRPTTNLFSPYYEEVVHGASPQTPPKNHQSQSSQQWKRLSTHPNVKESNCLYDGKVKDDPNSVVSINACQGTLHGMIVLGNGEQYSIEDHPNTLKNKKQTYAPSSTQPWGTLSQNYHVSLVNVGEERKTLKNDPGVCLEQQTPGKLAASLSAASSMDDHGDIHALQDESTPTEKRYVEIVLYHDYARCASFNTTQGLTNDQIISLVRANGLELFHNMAAYYKHGQFSHNINLILKGHVFFLNGDPYYKYMLAGGQVRVTGNRGLLSVFNSYRTRYGHYNHDVGILLSGTPFQDNIRGLANVASGCSSTAYNGNINQVTYRNPVMNSVLITHELGHCLSAMHDDVAGYIMSPYVSTSVIFSPRSKRAINNFMANTHCLINSTGAVMDADWLEDDYDPLTDPLNMRAAASKEKRKTSPIYLYDLEDTTTYEHGFNAEHGTIHKTPEQTPSTHLYSPKDVALALALTALTCIAGTSLLSWALFRYFTRDSTEKSKYDELQKKYTHLIDLYNERMALDYPQSPHTHSPRDQFNNRNQAKMPNMGLTIQSPIHGSPPQGGAPTVLKQPVYPDLPSPQEHPSHYHHDSEAPQQR